MVVAHEAIENALKALLIDRGVPRQTYQGHHLDRTLKLVCRHNSLAFGVIDLYFRSAVKFCGELSGQVYDNDIFEYFRKNFSKGTYEASKYGSIEESNDYPGSEIHNVTDEVIRALDAIVLGLRPRDIYVRIEEEAAKAILAERGLDPAWDADGWIEQGPIRPRLEVAEGLESNKVLRAAIRRCHREGSDSMVRHWAMWIRFDRVEARMRTHNKVSPYMPWDGLADRMSKRRG